MSTSTAVMTMGKPEPGEVVAVASFDMASYVTEMKQPSHAAQQKALMALYDAACDALIGENDVQQEGNRTFKKKSAWRKLARHFGISVHATLDDVRIEQHEGGAFTAVATARAVAPWGQVWTDVGACGSDEGVGRRVITIADAIATAMTRASNRAVSNLIAMGEVSAEEVGRSGGHGTSSSAPAPQRASAPANRGGNGAKVMPFGKHKGKPLADLDEKELRSTIAWCREKGKFADLITDCEAELARRNGPPAVQEADEYALLEEPTDDLPF